jgi:hypothetical protein
LEDVVVNARTYRQPTRQTALAVWSVFAAAFAAFAVFAIAVAPRSWVAGDEALPLAWVAAGMSALCFVAARGVPRLYAAQRLGPGVRAQATLLVRLALCEGAGLVSCVAWMLTRSPWAAGALGVAVLGVLLAFPSERRWRALGAPQDTELTSDERAAGIARAEAKLRRSYIRGFWVGLVFLVVAIAVLAFDIGKSGPAWSGRNWRQSLLLIGVACIPLLFNIVSYPLVKALLKRARL